MSARLVEGANCPARVTHDLPVGNPLEVDRFAAILFVRVKEFGRLADSSEAQGVHAKSPLANQSPGQVLGCLANVGELPVDHPFESGWTDQYVSDPKVAVDQDESVRRRRLVAPKPANAKLECRVGLVDPIEISFNLFNRNARWRARRRR